MLAGAYTKDLREAYDSGEDIRGAGILNMKAKAVQYSMTTLLPRKSDDFDTNSTWISGFFQDIS